METKKEQPNVANKDGFATPVTEAGGETPADPTKTKEFQESLKELKALASKDGPTTGYEVVQRLISGTFLNPYDVLMLGPEASEEEIKKQHRTLSLMVHPDKNPHERAADAFHLIDQAYKTLQNPEQRKLYQRVMREARERVEYERRVANKKRASQGLGPLPEETFQIEVRAMTKQLFDEIEEKKLHFQRMEMSSRKRMQEEREKIEKQEQAKKEEQKEWEHTRDKRVKSWRKFRDSRLNGKKKAKFEIRPPEVKAEERPEHAPKAEGSKPMGIHEEYKKSWK